MPAVVLPLGLVLVIALAWRSALALARCAGAAKRQDIAGRSGPPLVAPEGSPSDELDGHVQAGAFAAWATRRTFESSL